MPKELMLMELRMVKDEDLFNKSNGIPPEMTDDELSSGLFPAQVTVWMMNETYRPRTALLLALPAAAFARSKEVRSLTRSLAKAVAVELIAAMTAGTPEIKIRFLGTEGDQA